MFKLMIEMLKKLFNISIPLHFNNETHRNHNFVCNYQNNYTVKDKPCKKNLLIINLGFDNTTEKFIRKIMIDQNVAISKLHSKLTDIYEIIDELKQFVSIDCIFIIYPSKNCIMKKENRDFLLGFLNGRAELNNIILLKSRISKPFSLDIPNTIIIKQEITWQLEIIHRLEEMNYAVDLYNIF